MNARLLISNTMQNTSHNNVHALHNVKSKEITTSDDFETIFFSLYSRALIICQPTLDLKAH